jgi:hypothetical protein
MKKLLLCLLLSNLFISQAIATDYTQDAACAVALLMDIDPGAGTTTANIGSYGDVALASAGNPDWVSDTTNPKTYSDGYFTFDGVNDYLISSDADAVGFNNTSGSSITAWYNLTNSNLADWARLSESYEGDGWTMILDNSNPRKIYFTIMVGGVEKSTWDVRFNFTDNTWFHFGATFTSSYNLLTYKNGIAQGTAVSCGALGNADTYLQIGRYGGGYKYNFNGVDEFSYFRGKCLTSTEINDIMDNGLVGSAAPPPTINDTVLVNCNLVNFKVH